MYNFEIIEALLEDGESFADNKRVEFVEHKNHPSQGTMKVVIESRPVSQTTAEQEPQAKECDFNDKEMKEAWTNAFLNEGGFKYVCNALLNYDLALINSESNDKVFDHKHIGFMMTLTKVFLSNRIKKIDLAALTTKLVQIVA